MTGGDLEGTLTMILRALDRSHQRAILHSGWAGVGDGRSLTADASVVQSVPHNWLFPRAAAVVHHGKARTTGAGLRAGVPSVHIPFVADQPSWGRRIASQTVVLNGLRLAPPLGRTTLTRIWPGRSTAAAAIIAQLLPAQLQMTISRPFNVTRPSPRPVQPR
jgi:hypothetical protein